MKTIFKGEHYVKDVAVLTFKPIKPDSKLYYKYVAAFKHVLADSSIEYDDIAPRQCLKGTNLDGLIAYTHEIKITTDNLSVFE